MGGPLAISVRGGGLVEGNVEVSGSSPHCSQHHRAIWRRCRVHVVGDVLDVIPERILSSP